MLDQLSADQFTLIFCGTVIGVSLVALALNVFVAQVFSFAIVIQVE